MRRAIGIIAICVILSVSLPAQEPEPKPDFEAFSKLIHKTVVRGLPKEFADNSGWGATIPVPPNLPLPNLRTYVKVGDKLEVPHGPWQRFKGKLENPDKNLKIAVKEFKMNEGGKSYRLAVDVDVTLMCQGEWQLWQKGLPLIGVEAVADAKFTAALVCDVGVNLELTTFPPQVTVAPKVTELGLNLVDFKFRNEPIFKGEKADSLRRDLKEVLRTLVKASEPLVKDYANQAIAQSLKDGNGAISAGEILKALPAPK